jgi:threonine synthase
MAISLPPDGDRCESPEAAARVPPRASVCGGIRYHTGAVGISEIDYQHYDWQAGDAVHVPPPKMTRHEHFNPSDRRTRTLRIECGIRYFYEPLWKGYHKVEHREEAIARPDAGDHQPPTYTRTMPAATPLLERYRQPVARVDERFPITLGEGDTPLIHARRLGADLGLERLYLKFEGTNPSGSFKDRGMVLAVNRALSSGARAVVCASTGNTSASAAAYAAAAGLPCFVVLPAGKVARGKLAQALVAGARLVMIDGNFDAALDAVRRLGEEGTAVVVNSINPDRIEGQSTAAWEVCDALGDAPDALALPVGNAGNITAYWRGFRRYADAGRIARRPRMLGFQAAGAAPIVHGAPVEQPETVATAIRIGNPASWRGAVAARDESGGTIEAVTDDEILAAQRDVVTLEGIFCEPASAAGVAGVRRLAREGRIHRSETVVCVLTGHGLKDPDAVQAEEGSLRPVAPELDAIRLAMGLR